MSKVPGVEVRGCFGILVALVVIAAVSVLAGIVSAAIRWGMPCE